MKQTRLILSFVTTTSLLLAVLPFGNVLADPGGPVTSAVVLAPNPTTINTSVTITANVDDTTTANINIKSAEFSVNSGAWTEMTAVDGAFDSPTEAVTATFTATPLGTYDVCVQATDVADLAGDPVCASLTVQSLYTFMGFKAPIKPNQDNKAKAGSTIPVKWKLTLASTGANVKDKASFVAVESYGVDCTSLLGDSSTAVVEKGPGKTKVTNLGAGKWQFNWKTPKNYKASCRKIFVLFNDGLKSPEVVFRFK